MTDCVSPIYKFYLTQLKTTFSFGVSITVLRIRIRRIRMFLGLLDPDPLVRGMDPAPDPSIIDQK
jgi:hypothetical protein